MAAFGFVCKITEFMTDVNADVYSILSNPRESLSVLPTTARRTAASVFIFESARFVFSRDMFRALTCN